VISLNAFNESSVAYTPAGAAALGTPGKCADATPSPGISLGDEKVTISWHQLMPRVLKRYSPSKRVVIVTSTTRSYASYLKTKIHSIQRYTPCALMWLAEHLLLAAPMAVIPCTIDRNPLPSLQKGGMRRESRCQNSPEGANAAVQHGTGSLLHQTLLCIAEQPGDSRFFKLINEVLIPSLANANLVACCGVSNPAGQWRSTLSVDRHRTWKVPETDHR
jgi:hypothetical protein